MFEEDESAATQTEVASNGSVHLCRHAQRSKGCGHKVRCAHPKAKGERLSVRNCSSPLWCKLYSRDGIEPPSIPDPDRPPGVKKGAPVRDRPPKAKFAQLAALVQKKTLTNILCLGPRRPFFLEHVPETNITHVTEWPVKQIMEWPVKQNDFAYGPDSFDLLCVASGLEHCTQKHIRQLLADAYKLAKHLYIETAGVHDGHWWRKQIGWSDWKQRYACGYRKSWIWLESRKPTIFPTLWKPPTQRTNRRVAIALLTCNRIDYLRRTLESLHRHNSPLDQFLLFAGDDASTDSGLIDMVRSFGFTYVFRHKERKGCGASTNELLLGLANDLRPDDLLLCLQSDWECVRPIPYDMADILFDEPLIQSLRLFGVYKTAEGRQACSRRHLGSGRPIMWEPYPALGERVEVGYAHWTHCPSMTRARIVKPLLGGTSIEREAIIRSARLGLLNARVLSNVFSHIGKARTGGFVE